jgi:hypothetical protein
MRHPKVLTSSVIIAGAIACLQPQMASARDWSGRHAEWRGGGWGGAAPGAGVGSVAGARPAPYHGNGYDPGNGYGYGYTGRSSGCCHGRT